MDFVESSVYGACGEFTASGVRCMVLERIIFGYRTLRKRSSRYCHVYGSVIEPYDTVANMDVTAVITHLSAPTQLRIT